MTKKKYTNIYGEPTTLSMLCLEEPTWAASQIRKLDKLVESLKCCGNCTNASQGVSGVHCEHNRQVGLSFTSKCDTWEIKE